MRETKSIRKDFPADEVVTLTKGQRTVIDGKRVVITRTKQNTVWYTVETTKQTALAVMGAIKAKLASAWEFARGKR